YDLSPKRFDRDLIALRARVATSRGASVRGNVQISSKPSGGRVFIDGKHVGETPLNVGSLALGKHLLRIERVGYVVHGEVLEISTDNPEVRVSLRPTKEF